jgi:hypothetical protein
VKSDADRPDQLFLIPRIDKRWVSSKYVPNWRVWEAEHICCFFLVRSGRWKPGGEPWAFAVMLPPDTTFCRTEQELIFELKGQAEEALRELGESICRGKPQI